MNSTRYICLAVNLDAVKADAAIVSAGATGEPDRVVGGLQITLVQRDTVVWRLFFRRASAVVRLSSSEQIAIGARTPDFATTLFSAVATAGEVEVNLGTEQAPIWAYDVESDLNTTEINDALAATASIEAVADIELSAAGDTPTSFRFKPRILKDAYTGEPPTAQPGQTWLDLATGDNRYASRAELSALPQAPISVSTNAAKLALTGIAAGQLVIVTGEWNRVEMYLGTDPSSDANWAIVGNRVPVMAAIVNGDAGDECVVNGVTVGTSAVPCGAIETEKYIPIEDGTITIASVYVKLYTAQGVELMGDNGTIAQGIMTSPAIAVPPRGGWVELEIAKAV